MFKKNTKNHLIFDLLDEAQISAEELYKNAEKGQAIWGYIDIFNPRDNTAFLSFFNGETYNCFGMIRREENYLSRYMITFNSNDEMILKIQEMCHFNYDNFVAWFERYITKFNETYIDKDNLTPELQRYLIQLSEEELEEYLQKHKTMPITEEYFIKK